LCPSDTADAPPLLPLQGGAYLTLLNTIANMGVTLPKLAIFAVMDLLSDRTCVGAMDKVRGSSFQFLSFKLSSAIVTPICGHGPAVGPHLRRRHGQGEREAFQFFLLEVPFV
jgi:Acetyl-coenzyme A transporter 1